MKSRPSSFYLILLAIFLCVGSIQVQAQENKPVVTSIEVQYAGPAGLSKERILANMRTAVGKPYSDATVEEDIRNLYATGNVSNVRIFGEPTREGGVKVIVVIQTKATVNEVVVEGASRISEKRIRKEISAKVGDPISEANLETDRQKILNIYQEKGFTDAQVTYRIDSDERAGKGRVIFTILEGAKQEIRSVSFEGNTAFTSKQLGKKIKTRKHNLLSFLTKTGRVQSDVLDQDVATLRETYQDAGYIDAKIAAPQVTPAENGGVNVLFQVTEGAQYTVGKVQVSGAEVFSTDELMNQVKTAPGATFSPTALRADVKRISDMYGARGYVDLLVDPQVSQDGKNAVDIDIRIVEGSQSYVERVDISGNTKTKDKVIRRELAVAPGDVYNTVLVEASKQRLIGMDYFERVDLTPGETEVPGRKDLEVRVEEKRTGAFNFGAGFSSVDNLLGFAEIQQKNFDLFKPWSFTGGGQRFRARVQYGTKRKDVILSLVEPYFLDYKLELGGDLFYRDAQYMTNVYNQSNAGFDIFVRRPLGKFAWLRGEYRLENIEISDVDSDASDIIKAEAGSYIRSAVAGSVIYDTRDSLFLSRKGERVEFSTHVAGLGGNVQDYGFTLNGSKYFNLKWDSILILNGEIATVDNFGGDGVPIFDRLFLGGANTLRGFDFRDVGPKDENGEPIGGKTLARATIEYTIPVVDRVRAAVFYDIGFVNSGAYDFSPSGVNSDVGVGLRLDLPIGPIRLDYGIPVQSDEFNGGSGKFNFNIGWQFD